MTKLKYLDDTYLYESVANFLEIREDDFGKAVILDSTIFYPQGGGQPTDAGKIISDNASFLVKKVMLDKDGTVFHFGEFEKGSFNKNETVKLKIDKEKRISHAKLHSAAHLIDCAVESIGLYKQLTPEKGFQFPAGPYVEYEGTLENPPEYVNKITKKVNELVAQDIKILSETISHEEAKKQGVSVPAGKPARLVSFEKFRKVGCGGTHVNSSSEIGKIIIRKIKLKKGKTKIAYALET